MITIYRCENRADSFLRGDDFASDGKPILSNNSQYDVCFSFKTKRTARSLTFII